MKAVIMFAPKRPSPIERAVKDYCCPKCHLVLKVGYWPFCPHGRDVGYGWKFKQGQNESRREDYHKKMASDPFSGIGKA